MWRTKSIFLICIILYSFTAFSQNNQVNDRAEDEKQGLHADGGSWDFFTSKSKGDSIFILLIGDSILKGYHQDVIDKLDSVATIDYWVTGMHLNSPTLLDELTEKVSYKAYDVVHFNIGLHGWQEGRIPTGQYVPLLEKYLQTIRVHAPQASIIWASTTPVTELDNAILNEEINPIIVKRNQLAQQVMQENEIPVNDLYNLMVDKLELARLDRFHWNQKGYQLMSDQIATSVLEALTK
ncbi:MAG: SGNH/GDSL hydrolase family protein [Cyclobacteriaceae bacterium]|nr:SGNH/GDSL hydrolase family protein [Cyclobacteriaceae bacterium SS2]